MLYDGLLVFLYTNIETKGLKHDSNGTAQFAEFA